MTLRQMRTQAGLSQDEVAAKTGLSQMTLSQLELGRVPSPLLDTLEKIAAAYGKDLLTIVAALKASIDEAAA